MSKTISSLDKLIKLLNKLDKDWYPDEDVLKIHQLISMWKKKYEFSAELERFSMLQQIESLTKYNVLLARQVVFYYTNTKFYDVYKHTSPNGKVYIGITSQENKFRWNDGIGYEENSLFYADIQKYGWDKITHEILCSNIDIIAACEMERDLIKKYNSKNPEFGYNIDSGGKMPSIPKLWQYDYIYQYRCRFNIIKLIVEIYDLEKSKKQVNKWGDELLSVDKIDNPWGRKLFLLKIKHIKDND